MKFSELSKLKTKELKMILKKQKVKNYSNMSKAELLEKIKKVYKQKGGSFAQNQIATFKKKLQEINDEISKLEIEKANLEEEIKKLNNSEKAKVPFQPTGKAAFQPTGSAAVQPTVQKNGPTNELAGKLLKQLKKIGPAGTGGLEHGTESSFHNS
jgi:hypothetical protein